MVDIVHEVLGDQQPFVCISGPSFARELMEEQPTGCELPAAMALATGDCADCAAVSSWRARMTRSLTGFST